MRVLRAAVRLPLACSATWNTYCSRSASHRPDSNDRQDSHVFDAQWASAELLTNNYCINTGDKMRAAEAHGIAGFLLNFVVFFN
jgi:hypothetical protein